MRIVFKLFIYNILIKNNKLYMLFKEQFEPSLWFGPSLSHNKTHDLFPSHWTKI